MGYQTDALVHISFNRETFDSKNKVLEYIEDEKTSQKYALQTLNQLAWMTEPKKFCEDDEDPSFYIQRNLNEALEELQKATINIFKAQCVLDAWDYMHDVNGLALDRNGDFEELQRIDGDFIKTVSNQNIVD